MASCLPRPQEAMGLEGGIYPGRKGRATALGPGPAVTLHRESFPRSLGAAVQGQTTLSAGPVLVVWL